LKIKKRKIVLGRLGQNTSEQILYTIASLKIYQERKIPIDGKNSVVYTEQNI